VKRSLFELVTTLVPFLAAMAALFAAVATGTWWLYVLLVPPAALLVVRLFMIQHDCGHGSFFADRRANDWTGRVISTLTLTPYDVWRRAHAIHHATAGHLDRRGVGDISTLTVAEYRALGWRGRLAYRLYRHPLVMFGIGPIYVFFLQGRLPIGFMTAGVGPWASAMATNLGIVAVTAPLVWAFGLGTVLAVELPVLILAGAVGVWLFYVQHQFEDMQWYDASGWDVHEAALHGSSYYVLPPVLRWFTANIGMHHVHHLSSRIPFYRLPEVMRAHPELESVGRLTLLESLACVRLTLWDEKLRRLISFRELRALHG
jgi:omega-6 fatty acid desaturase (delta-12 desaturase)